MIFDNLVHLILVRAIIERTTGSRLVCWECVWFFGSSDPWSSDRRAHDARADANPKTKFARDEPHNFEVFWFGVYGLLHPTHLEA